jgi:predicted esterase
MTGQIQISRQHDMKAPAPLNPIALWLLIASWLVTTSPRAGGVTADDFLAFSYTNGSGQVLPCRLWVPANLEPGRRYPLVLFLHGAGERGNDNRSQLAVNPAPMVFAAPHNQANWPCFLLAPQCPAGQTWAGMTQGDRWSDPDGTGDFTAEPPWTLAAAMAVLGQLTNASPYALQIDTSRVFVTGLSMGGYGSWEAICRWPGLFKAAVPICGGGDPTRLASITRTPVWAFHSADDPVVPVARARQMIQALRGLGVMPRSTEYPASMGIGHGAWVPAYADPDLLPWLFGRSVLQGGDGLLAEYYANSTFSGAPVIRRVERSFDLDWDTGSPGAGVPVDGFSARFTARLIVPQTGWYTFRLAADDRASLLVDGQTVISGSGIMTNAVVAELSLTNGLHDLEVDFVEELGGAWLRLAWASNSQPFQPLVEDSLFCPAPRVAPLAWTPGPGFYSPNQTVTVASVASDITIRYTTNGVLPTAASSLYVSPVVLTAPVTLRAVGFKSGLLDSAVSSADYFVTPILLSVPQSRGVQAGTNVTLAVSASGVGPLRYQWSWNGTELSDATNASLVLTNVQPAQSGFYLVRVMDDFGTNASPPAQIIIAFKPVIVSQPQSLTVLEGQEASFSVAVSGTPPLSYRWRRNGGTVTNITLAATTCVFTVTSAQLANAGNYTVAVTNFGGNAPLSSIAVLSVLGDFDRDGLPDLWMMQHFGHTNGLAADGSRAQDDPDVDGMSNQDEYIAGTEPNNPQSSLRVMPPVLGGGGGVRILWSSSTNRFYTLQRASELRADAATLTNLAQRIPATPPQNQFVDPASTNARQFFYRIQVER